MPYQWLGLRGHRCIHLILSVLPALCGGCRFFDAPKPLQVLQQMRRIAMPPDSLPGVIFRAMGRVTLLDVGVVSIAAHLLAKVVDANLLVWLMKLTGGGPDLRRMQQEARQQQQQQIASNVFSKVD